MDVLQAIYDSSINNISVIVAGIAGGAVTLIRVTRRKKIPLKVGQVFCSLFVAAFTAWMVALLLPQNINHDIRTAICGIAGMSGDRLLLLVERSSVKDIKRFIKGGL